MEMLSNKPKVIAFVSSLGMVMEANTSLSPPQCSSQRPLWWVGALVW